MKGESYFRALDQHRGSSRPAVSVAQPKRKHRDPIDIALKIVGGLLVWAGVFVAFMALYAGIIRLFGR